MEQQKLKIENEQIPCLLMTNKAGQEIKVTYTATLNKDAVTGFDANKNSATVEYSNKPGTDNKGESEPSIVDVHTFNFHNLQILFKWCG